MKVAGKLLVALIGISAHAQTDDAQRAAQEAQAKQKLAQIRATIHELADEQKQTTAKHGEAVVALREQELKVAATARTLRELDQKLAVEQS